MLTHYLKTAVRFLLRQRIYTLLNVLGLTIGMSCAIIIFLFVQDEWAYDQFHTKKDQLHRLTCTYYLPDDAGVEYNAYQGPVVGEMLVKDYPEIVQAVRVQAFSSRVVQFGEEDTRHFETIAYADSNFFELFSFPLLQGNASSVLHEPHTIVLSESAARKYFGRTDVVGEYIRMPEEMETAFEVTGVMADFPSQSHFKLDFIASLETRYKEGAYMESWWSFSTYTYLELAPEVDVAALESKISDISRRYIADQEDGSGYRQEYHLQSLTSIHLNSDLRGEWEANSKESYVYIFLIIGIFLVLIACVNFVNLATARSLGRAKEVGLRKVVGASRGQLISQFLGESGLLAAFSLLLSVLIVWGGMGLVNGFTGKELSLSLIANPWLLLLLGGLLVIVGLGSGAYPAFFLSNFRPAHTLKGSFKSGRKGLFLRKGLVVGQFGISIVLIISTLAIALQFRYMQQKDLGFAKDQVVFVPTKYVDGANESFQRMKERLEQLPDFEQVSLSSRVPGKGLGNNVLRLGWEDDAEWSDMRYLAVDEDFVPLYKLKLIAGRTFDKAFGTDAEEAFLINESGMERIGYTDPEELLGKKVRWQNRRGRIVGVLKDFHFRSVNQAILPMLVIMNHTRTPGYLSVRLSGTDYPQAISQLESAFAATIPNGVFEYSFLDQDFDRQYKADQRFMSIFSVFAIIAILIACLGLYGLSALTAAMKVREVGIRKVLGASVWQVVVLLSRDFARLVLIAAVLAIPIAWYGLREWLQTMPYQTHLSWWIFALGGLLALMIACLTVSYHAIRSARSNPVEALAYE